MGSLLVLSIFCNKRMSYISVIAKIQAVLFNFGDGCSGTAESMTGILDSENSWKKCLEMDLALSYLG